MHSKLLHLSHVLSVFAIIADSSRLFTVGPGKVFRLAASSHALLTDVEGDERAKATLARINVT